jgi:hypothetical protein
MSTIYNVQAAEVDIIVIKGDTPDISFSVDLNAAAYVLTGKQLDMKIKKFDGTVVKTLSSVGASPAITISSDTFNIKTTAFAETGTFKYDLQVTSGTDIYTIMNGKLIIKEEQTTAT